MVVPRYQHAEYIIDLGHDLNVLVALALLTSRVFNIAQAPIVIKEVEQIKGSPLLVLEEVLQQPIELLFVLILTLLLRNFTRLVGDGAT